MQGKTPKKHLPFEDDVLRLTSYHFIIFHPTLILKDSVGCEREETWRSIVADSQPETGRNKGNVTQVLNEANILLAKGEHVYTRAVGQESEDQQEQFCRQGSLWGLR